MSTGQENTNALSIDCEMVEAAGGGLNGFVNMVARVSLVNEYGKCVYDTYVKPTKPVSSRLFLPLSQLLVCFHVNNVKV